MATLTYTTPSPLGVAVPFVAASAGGDQIAPNSKGVLFIRNADTTATIVTVVVPGEEYGQARPDYTISVGVGEIQMVGPLPRDLIGTNGQVSLTYSKVTALTVAGVSV